MTMGILNVLYQSLTHHINILYANSIALPLYNFLNFVICTNYNCSMVISKEVL